MPENESKRAAASVPTGTVTFLFTDIEGSTSMWERNPVQMQQALARHNEIMRGAVEGHGGYVFKTVGDAFCASFATARQALEATLAAQRALHSESWEEGVTVRARMALHTGVAEERDGDYFGPPVNRVARLESAGHGGQVLLSSVTYGLVRDDLSHLEEGAQLRDLSEHRLKDLRYAERIYQLVVPDLPSEFPALKTLDTRSDERYELRKLIGQGGMAEVYLARDKELDRDVAFKVLKKQYTDDEDYVERFKREARSAAALSHPNIVSVYDRGKTPDGAYYIVMEHVSGGTLEERILKEGLLSTPTVVELTLQMARALETAHERGVIHRDIKPQNVLLTESGEAKVADFGIARAASSSTMTRTGLVMGTAHYLSPEQALGEPTDPKSDLYSLGVVLYEMLSGELPHDSDTPMGIAMKHMKGELQPPKEVNPNIPEWVNTVVVRLLARNPKERYQSATELIRDLERAQRGESSAFSADADGREAGTTGPADTLAPSPEGSRDERSSAGPSEKERYERVRPLGSGGMAEVYLAHDNLLDRDVALKVLRKQYADDEQFVERFEREAMNAAKLSHPNIVAIHDRGRTADGSYYIVMEHVPGGTLKERIQREEDPLPAPAAIDFTRQIAQALGVAHRRGVIHRDIKPQNVLLTEWGEAKVADFGIARAASSSTMTRTGLVMGTAHYLSPEQALGEPTDPKSDLYSLGVVLYEMLTGQVPHDAETPMGIAMKHVSGHMRPPKEINPGIPEELNAVVVRLLARNLEERYQSAAELVEDFERMQRGEPPGFLATLQRATVIDGTVAESPGLPSSGDQPAREREPGQVPTVPPLAQPVTAGQGERRGGMLPWVLGATGLLVVAALVGLGAYLQRGTTSQSDPQGTPTLAALPKVVGLSRDQAEETLESQGFEVETKTEESSLKERGTVVEQSPPGGDEAEESSTVAITVGEGLQPASGYAVIENISGKLAVEVPSNWSDTITDKEGNLKGEDVDPGEGIGPAITATTDLDAWADANRLGVPGVYILASRELAPYTEDELLDLRRADVSSCELGPRQNFDRSPYSGRMQWANCGEDGDNSRLMLAATLENRECALILQIVTYSTAERDAARHILNTFEADCQGIS
jgi:serine/threonine protein kinase/class 3 adenylate cyclase